MLASHCTSALHQHITRHQHKLNEAKAKIEAQRGIPAAEQKILYAGSSMCA